VFLKFFDCLIHDLLVCLKPDFIDKSALFATKQVACTANFQVLHRDVESASKFTELLQGMNPLARIFGHHRERRRYEIAESFFVASSNPSSHLMQVRQSKILGIINKYRVG